MLDDFSSDRLRAFIAAADEGSFSAGFAKSQSTASISLGTPAEQFRKKGRDRRPAESPGEEERHPADQERRKQPQRDDEHFGREARSRRMLELMTELMAAVHHPMPTDVTQNGAENYYTE